MVTPKINTTSIEYESYKKIIESERIDSLLAMHNLAGREIKSSTLDIILASVLRRSSKFIKEVIDQCTFWTGGIISKIILLDLPEYFIYLSRVHLEDLKKRFSLMLIFKSYKILECIINSEVPWEFTDDNISRIFQQGSLRIVQRLIRSGHVPRAHDMGFIINNSIEVIDYIFSLGYSFQDYAGIVIEKYISNGNVEMTRRFLAGHNVSLDSDLLNFVDNPDMLEFILGLGVKCNECNILKFVIDRYLECLKSLHTLGYNLSEDRYICHSEGRITLFLLGCGANPRACNDIVLEKNMINRHYDTCKELILLGCRINDSLRCKICNDGYGYFSRFILEFFVSEGINLSHLPCDLRDNDAIRFALDYEWYHEDICPYEYISHISLRGYKEKQNNLDEDIIRIIKKRDNRRMVMHNETHRRDICFVFP